MLLEVLEGCSALGSSLEPLVPLQRAGERGHIHHQTHAPRLRVRQQVAEECQADMGFRVPEPTWRWVPERSEQEALGTAFQELGGDRLQER